MYHMCHYGGKVFWLTSSCKYLTWDRNVGSHSKGPKLNYKFHNLYQNSIIHVLCCNHHRFRRKDPSMTLASRYSSYDQGNRGHQLNTYELNLNLYHTFMDRRRVDQLLVCTYPNCSRTFVVLEDMNGQMIFGSKVHQLVIFNKCDSY